MAPVRAGAPSWSIFRSHPLPGRQAKRRREGMKTSLAGSRSSWPSNQASRRFRTSGRSCSSACADFFERPAAQSQPVAQRAAADAHESFRQEPLDHLVQRDVSALFDHPDNEVGMRVEPRAAPPSLGSWCGLAQPGSADPTDRARYAHPEPSRRLARRSSLGRGLQDTRPQILTQCPRHLPPPSR